MRHYALLGETLRHSLSVPIHEMIFRETGFSATYELIKIPRADFSTQAKDVLSHLDGCNVTIPYKQEGMALLHSVDEAAGKIGAVNTISRHDGVLRGHNTDAPGLAAMLLENGLNPAGQVCFVLGTGGAAKAAVYTLNKLGAKQVLCVSRRTEENDPAVISYQELDAMTKQVTGLLINATPVGMWPRTEDCPLPADVIARFSGVADLIYNPPQTRLTEIAAQVGIPAVTGLHMLVEQAVKAQEIWQERPLPPELPPYLMKNLNLFT